MFHLLPEQWTPVLPLAALTENPLAFEAAGERLVAFRDASGKWRVLLDRCPHRGAALSRGAITSDGDLQCAYHGWRFAGDGHCTRVPLNELPASALARIRATAIPSRELAGALWVYTGSTMGTEPDLPSSLQGPAMQFGAYCQEWHAHWTRAVENFIDFAHPPYVHRDTIGAWTRDAAEQGVIARVEVEETGFGLRTRNFLGNRGNGFQVDWHRPNLSRLHFGSSDDSKLHVFSIPLRADLTRVMTVRRLPHGYDAADYAGQSGGVDHPILDEDRLVVESQTGPVPTDNREEISVATDAPSVAFRRWYRDAVVLHPAARPATA